MIFHPPIHLPNVECLGVIPLTSHALDTQDVWVWVYMSVSNIYSASVLRTFYLWKSCIIFYCAIDLRTYFNPIEGFSLLVFTKINWSEMFTCGFFWIDDNAFAGRQWRLTKKTSDYREIDWWTDRSKDTRLNWCFRMSKNLAIKEGKEIGKKCSVYRYILSDLEARVSSPDQTNK